MLIQSLFVYLVVKKFNTKRSFTLPNSPVLRPFRGIPLKKHLDYSIRYTPHSHHHFPNPVFLKFNPFPVSIFLSFPHRISHWDQGKTICPKSDFQPSTNCKCGNELRWLAENYPETRFGPLLSTRYHHENISVAVMEHNVTCFDSE